MKSQLRNLFKRFERFVGKVEQALCGINPFITVFDYQFLGVRLRRTFVRTTLGQLRDGHLLDVGCGTQPYRGYLAPECRYTGIDIHSAHPETVVVAPDSIWPNIEPADMIVCTEVIEHVKDVRVFCAQIDNVLRPGGLLIISAPFLYKVHDAHDYRRLTIEEYRNYFPFEISEAKTLGGVGTVLVVNGLAWIYTSMQLTRIGYVAYLLLLPIRLLVNCTANLLGMLLDGVDRTGMFYGGSIVVMKKPVAHD